MKLLLHIRHQSDVTKGFDSQKNKNKKQYKAGCYIGCMPVSTILAIELQRISTLECMFFNANDLCPFVHHAKAIKLYSRNSLERMHQWTCALCVIYRRVFIWCLCYFVLPLFSLSHRDDYVK